MNGQVDDMVAGDIGAMEPVIEGETEKADGPVQCEDIGECAKVPDKVSDAPGSSGRVPGRCWNSNEADENNQGNGRTVAE
jgi:hypothetical protein